MYIIKFCIKRNIVILLLVCMKEKLLNDTEKETIYDIVMSLKRKTPKQKARFNMYYGLDPDAKECISVSKMAKYYECKESSIRGSIQAIVFALFYIPEDKILLLKKIIEDKIGN